MAKAVSREHVSITLPKEYVEWLDKQVQDRKYFSRSHAIEILILQIIKKTEKTET